MTVELDEGQRQIVLMALVVLAEERPGWTPAAITPIVERLGGVAMFAALQNFRTPKTNLPPVDGPLTS